MININDIPVAVKEIAAVLKGAGYKAWLVGGCVRDMLLKRKPSDWDLTTDAFPIQVISLFPNVIPTGIAHGTVTVHTKSGDYEVTTFRSDGAYSDGRHPDEVVFVKSLYDDLARRDFTINAIAADPVTGEIFDPFYGQFDLEDGIIRAVGHPLHRFDEDGLRILRAARFAGNLGFYITGGTATAMRACVGNLKNVSMERVHAEFKKAIVRSPKPSMAFRSMESSGILNQLGFPMDQHFADNLVRLDAAPRRFECGMVALMFHTPSDQVDAYMRQLKASNDERKFVTHLVDVLQTSPSPEDLLVDPRSMREWGFHVTRKYLDAAVELHFPGKSREAVLQYLKSVPLHIGELNIDGHVLLSMGVAPKEIGTVLRKLVSCVLVDPSLNEQERLMTLVDPFRMDDPVQKLAEHYKNAPPLEPVEIVGKGLGLPDLSRR